MCGTFIRLFERRRDKLLLVHAVVCAAKRVFCRYSKKFLLLLCEAIFPLDRLWSVLADGDSSFLVSQKLFSLRLSLSFRCFRIIKTIELD